MYDLVEVRKDDLFTNSKVIAEGTENQHKNVKELIEKYLPLTRAYKSTTI